MSDSSSAGQLVGAVLNGRWRLLRLLGEGGMGAVYEAEGVRGEGKRAIKLLHQEFVKEDQILQRFYAEAQATRALVHPNIAQVIDSATAEDGTPYLVMELLVGTSLASYMESGSAIPPSHAVPIIYGVLQALTVAHNQRLVHRDLKPDNLFLVRDARGTMIPKVLDFGIAKVMDVAGGMGQKTRTGVLLGTPGYMSPEQIKNSKGVDPRTDLWSVGIILYEMLT
ncbi:MAG: serine/threonine-protein kinase, partial [Byssovorax sp.]